MRFLTDESAEKEALTNGHVPNGHVMNGHGMNGHAMHSYAMNGQQAVNGHA